MPKQVIGILIIIGMILLYILLYYLNKKTPVPKGCENVKDLESKCSSCSNTTCAFKKKEESKNE